MDEKCPHCGYPLTWSNDRRQTWCAVFGTHPEIRAPRPNLLLIKACQFSEKGSAPRQRKMAYARTGLAI